MSAILRRIASLLREACGERIYGVRVERLGDGVRIVVETSIGVDIALRLRAETLSREQVEDLCRLILA